jgi:hypothetical protein
VSTTTSYEVWHGTSDPPTELQELRAGAVKALLDGVDLRYVRLGRLELVRRLYVAVRDRNWNTIPGEIEALEVEALDDSFAVRFRVHHVSHDIDFSWKGEITGEPSGRITYTLDGECACDMHYNRIGICVHQPWREIAGRPYRAQAPNGEITGEFPVLIGPQQIVDGTYRALFPAYDHLEIDLAEGGTLLFAFEGDLWETEDHRNWTDANFKTYSTPIERGYPHEAAAGGRIAQRVTVEPVGVAAQEADPGPVRLTIGAPSGELVPPVGLSVASHGEPLTGAEVALLRALGPAHLRVDLRLDGDGWRDALARAQEEATRLACGLELALALRAEHTAQLDEIAAALAAGPPVLRVLAVVAGGRTSTPEETTPPELVDLARAHLQEAAPGAAFAGGTEIYFTELNRTRPQHARWDAVTYSITPQIHAFTDLDIVENLEAQAETVKSARALAGGKPVVVSPVTIKRRVNFHAAEPDPEPAPGELPDAVDPRQSSLLGAAWTAGSLAYLATAGAASVTYYETTGWRGVVETEAGAPVPERFRSRPGGAFPLYHVLADAAGLTGAEVLETTSSEPLRAVALTARDGEGTHVLLANLVPSEQDVVIGPLEGAVTLRRLDESAAERAALEPAAFRGDGEQVEAGGELPLRLDPYEVVRIDAGL